MKTIQTIDKKYSTKPKVENTESIITKDFENFLSSHKVDILYSFHPSFQKAFFEMVINGGKRFRPNLLFSVVNAKRKDKLKDSFEIALALEVLHTYSLIHDDLPSMDNATLRRNHQTLHIKYSEADAILVGDGLNSYAFYLIANSKFSDKIKVKLIKSLGFGSLKMIVGQACDCFFENQRLNKKQVDFIHINKTAQLIAASLKMGTIIAKLSKKENKQIHKLGILIGLFFQIRDDILDCTQNSNIAGKTTQNDTNKNSYVTLLGIQEAQNELEKIKIKIFKRLTKIDKDIAKNLKVLLRHYL